MNDQLFVLIQNLVDQHPSIQVYDDKPPFTHKFDIDLIRRTDLCLDHLDIDLSDIVACRDAACLFISGQRPVTNMHYLRRIDPGIIAGDNQKMLPLTFLPLTRDRRYSLSVRSLRILIAQQNELYVCDIDGELISCIKLPNTISVRCAVESHGDTFIICYHSDIIPSRYMFGELNADGLVMRNHIGPFCGWYWAMNHDYRRMILGPEGTVIVSDQNSNRILVLDDMLSLKRVETFAEPRWMCYIDNVGCLLVAVAENSQRRYVASASSSTGSYLEAYYVRPGKPTEWGEMRKTPASIRLINGCIYVDHEDADILEAEPMSHAPEKASIQKEPSSDAI